MQMSLRRAAVAAFMFVILACSGLQAQSTTTLSIAPTGYITAGLGRTVQFTAFLSSNTAQPDTNVTWSVGRPGMNTGLGSISSTGLYTAPAVMPSSGQIQINATDATMGISNLTFLYLLPAGPVLTGVMPATIPVGSVTLTVQGSGFVNGAVAMVGGTQVATSSVTTNSLSISFYQPAATSVNIYVKNPGTGPSNTLTVPVGGSATSGGGSGSGSSTPATLAIAPKGYITAGLGGTVQFTAYLGSNTTQPDTNVTWSVGRPGMSTGLGSISPTGLYTAPTVMPSSGQIQINATDSTAGTSNSTFLYLLPAGPTLTGVTPSPIPGGTVTLTLQGSGFVNNAVAFAGGTQYATSGLTSNSLSITIYQGAATSTTIYVVNPGTGPSNVLTVPVSATATGGGGSPGGNPGGGGNPPPPPPAAPVVAPAKATLALGGTQQFNAANTTGWSAVSGTVTATGLYTAPAVMPASGKDTVTATGAGGTGTATVTLVSNVPPVITAFGSNPLPLGVFSTTITGNGFTALSTAVLGSTPLAVTGFTANTLTVGGFAGAAAAGNANLVVSNGPVSSAPFAIQVGVANPVVSAAAARRFLEQAAFGPTAADAAHVQAIGFQAWIQEQLAMPVVSNYAPLHISNQGSMSGYFLANAVTNPDQLRQRVSFALSEIFVTSLLKLLNATDMAPYQDLLLNDAFTNYRQILGDVTLSPGMGYYLDMGNNAKADPVAGTVANENYAREVMQLFSLGVNLLNPDGSTQLDPVTQLPIPTYGQKDVTELARVFTGWTYAPAPGGQVNWGGFLAENGPMVAYPAEHDFGSKVLVNGYNAQANLSPLDDLNGALNNLASHPNTAPFISKQLIQHLVKSNPSPAYVQRVVSQFLSSNGDMPAVITAILLDPEARTNDEGGSDQTADGHLQEPALMLPAFIRAFNGQMLDANWWPSNLAALGQDVFSPGSVFNYFSPGFTVAGTGGLKGPEFQIDNPNATILRENLVANFFNQFSNPVQTYGPGTTVDLTAFVPLASTPATLVDALDLTLTHGVMPAAMKQIIVTAVTNDVGIDQLHQVETGIYLILTSSYYNVWH